MKPLTTGAMSEVQSWIDTYQTAHDLAGWPQGEPEWWNRRATHDGALKYIPTLDRRPATYLDYLCDAVIGVIVHNLYDDQSWRDYLPEIWAAAEMIVLERLHA